MSFHQTTNKVGKQAPELRWITKLRIFIRAKGSLVFKVAWSLTLCHKIIICFLGLNFFFLPICFDKNLTKGQLQQRTRNREKAVEENKIPYTLLGAQDIPALFVGFNGAFSLYSHSHSLPISIGLISCSIGLEISLWKQQKGRHIIFIWKHIEAMEKKKKKDHKSGSTAHQEVEEPNHLLVMCFFISVLNVYLS